jgi:hypothetical protein
MHGHHSRLSTALRVGTILGCCALPVLAGCSRVKVVPVEGKFTVTDGKPMPKGNVLLIPIESDQKLPRSALPPGGFIGDEGAYTVLWNGKPGAPVGKYRVVFQRSMDGRWNAIPAEYFNTEKSPLEVEVVENKPEGGYDMTVKARSVAQARSGQPDIMQIRMLKDQKLMEKEKQLKGKQ